MCGSSWEKDGRRGLRSSEVGTGAIIYLFFVVVCEAREV